MLEPFQFRSGFSDASGRLTTWAQRWITQLTAQVNSIIASIGIKSLNGDVTPAQNLVAGANVTITDDGAGSHTIAASGSVSSGLTSINGDSTPAQTFVDGTYTIVSDLGAGKHRIDCTLTPPAGFVTAVTGSAPVVIAGSATVPSVSVSIATSGAVGVVEPDNTTIAVDSSGIISVASAVVLNPPGVYADDAAAAAAGVAIGSAYRQPDGVMAWRVS